MTLLTLLLTISCVLSSAAEAPAPKKLTASEVFADMPISVTDMMDKSRRLDMLDYYAADSIAKVPNTMEGVSYLEKVTPEYLKVCLTPVSVMTIKILPYKKGEVIMVAYTVGNKDQAYDTDLRFYDTSFNELARDKFIKEPELLDFFVYQDKSVGKELTESIPFPTVRYIPDESGPGMRAELTVGQYLSKDDHKLVSRYLKPGALRYKWTGTKFNLEK